MAELQVDAQAEATAETTSKASSKASSDAEYKSDALDELLEDSLFKKKKADNSPESEVDKALHAKVDLKDFNLVEEKAETKSCEETATEDAGSK